MQISQDSLDQLFLNARTANGFTDQPIEPAQLRKVYDIAKSLLSGEREFLEQPAGAPGMTPAEALQQIQEIENNPEYWDRERKNPQRQKVLVERRLGLMVHAYPGMSTDPKSLRGG